MAIDRSSVEAIATAVSKGEVRAIDVVEETLAALAALGVTP